MTDKADKLGAIERLEDLLNKRDEEIADLRTKIRKQEDEDDEEAWLWTRHTESKEAEGLPVPRLEIRWTTLGRGMWNWLASYNFVYRHFLGQVIVVPLGRTRVGAGCERTPVTGGQVDLPYREGVHIRHDAWALRLPAYAICGNVVNKIEPGTDQQRDKVAR